VRSSAPTWLLVLLSALLGANLVATRTSSSPLELLPRAQAQQPPQPLETDLRTGKTLITASPAGDTLFVWTCRVVNGAPTFEVQRFASTH
jgi:hypothetical protein